MSALKKIFPFLEHIGSGSAYRKEFWWEREWRHIGNFKLPVNGLEALEGFKTIKAPFDGILTARDIDIGAYVAAGSGTQDILIAVIDGLKGFPEAITAVFPDAEIQTCIVHLIRNSLSFCNWKQRQPVARELKQIYEAETAELAAKRLEDFAEGPWGKKLPAIVQSWRRVWEQVIPFFAYPKEIRKIIYTTNAIESLHMQLRKVLKNREHFPGDEAATKLIYLALRDITKKWKNPPITWKLAATQFAISLWSEILCRGDLKTMKPVIARATKTDAGLRSGLAATRDLPTIAFFRAGPLLRRNGPVPGILAAARPGAIMDKSGRHFVATN